MLDSADLFPNLSSVTETRIWPLHPQTIVIPSPNFIYVHEWQMTSLFFIFYFFFNLPTWFWTRNELSPRLSVWESGHMSREAELEAQSQSELCTEELPVCSDKEAAGCAVWGAHQILLGQREMGPFGTGMESVLRSVSDLCSAWNPRWCRGKWELPSFNVMVGVATFPGSQNPFPCSILSTCGHALTFTLCNICCCGFQWASPIIWNFMGEHQVSLSSSFSLGTKKLPLYVTWEYSPEKQYLVSWSAFFGIGWSSLRACYCSQAVGFAYSFIG